MANRDDDRWSPERVGARLQALNTALDRQALDPILWREKALLYGTPTHTGRNEPDRLDGALECYEIVLERDAQWHDRYNLALILIQLQRYEEACAHLEAVTAQAPPDEHFWNLLISTCHRIGLNARADRYRTAARALGIATSTVVNGLGHPVEHLNQPDWDRQSFRQLYRTDRKELIKRVLNGELPHSFDWADPHLTALGLDLGTLSQLGLQAEAEQLCIQHETTHGPTNTTLQWLIMDRIDFHKESLSTERSELQDLHVSREHPLLDLAIAEMRIPTLPVAAILSERHLQITEDELNAFDDLVRAQLQQLNTDGYSMRSPDVTSRAIPKEVGLVWGMAVVNFKVARHLGSPTLIAYAAFRVAEFFRRIHSPYVPKILYELGARAAEDANRANYVACCRGNLARILAAEDDLGGELRQYERMQPVFQALSAANRYWIAREQVHMYSELGQVDRALVCLEGWRAAAAELHKRTDDIDEHKASLERQQQGLRSVDTFSVTPAHNASPVKEYRVSKTGIHEGRTCHAQSIHELYDEIRTQYATVLRKRRSLLGRSVGHRYFQEYQQLGDLLVHVALQIGPPFIALRHLESQKNIILLSRLRYLLESRPQDITDDLWTEFQDGLRILRGAIEGEPETHSIIPAGQAETGLRAMLWKMSQLTPDFTAVEAALGLGRLPQEIAADAAVPSLVLEFYCGPEGGACFVINPAQPTKPSVVPLDAMSLTAMTTLEAACRTTITRWTAADNIAEADAATRRFEEHLTLLNAIIGRPLATAIGTTTPPRACIIPHRILHALPLNLLSCFAMRHAPTSDQAPPALAFSPSLSILSRHRKAAPTTPTLLIVTDPTPRCPSDTCRNRSHDCFALPSARLEGAMIAAHARQRGWHVTELNDGATIDAVLAHAQTAQLVHFGCHNITQFRAIEKSGLLLATGSVEGSERVWCSDANRLDKAEAVGEVLTLERLWRAGDLRHCWFANLSCCATGAIDVTDPSDEFLSVANGFAAAGVRNILYCAWPVHDLCSLLFSRLFYAKLFSGATFSDALRDALGQLRRFTMEDIRAELADIQQDLGPQHPVASDDALLEGLAEVHGDCPFAHPLFWGTYRLLGGLR